MNHNGQNLAVHGAIGIYFPATGGFYIAKNLTNCALNCFSPWLDIQLHMHGLIIKRLPAIN